MEIHVMDDDAVKAQLCYRCEEEGEEEEEGGKEKTSKWYYEWQWPKQL